MDWRSTPWHPRVIKLAASVYVHMYIRGGFDSSKKNVTAPKWVTPGGAYRVTEANVTSRDGGHRGAERWLGPFLACYSLVCATLLGIISFFLSLPCLAVPSLG